MTSDAWPSQDAPPPALPRLEDLPISERGYDQEAVRLAFDTFYRHAAQLDASLRTLEAVEVFRRDADALRNDLRALREIGLGGPLEPPVTSLALERPRSDVPGIVLRLAAEAGLIIAVAVIAGVAHFRGWVIVAVMAGAFLVVAVCEWLASRARFVPPGVAFVPNPAVVEEPPPYVEAPVGGWSPTPTPVLAAGEDTEADALTIVEPEPATDPESEVDEDEEDGADDPRPAGDPWEESPADDPEVEPQLVERGGFFRRRRR